MKIGQVYKNEHSTNKESIDKTRKTNGLPNMVSNEIGSDGLSQMSNPLAKGTSVAYMGASQNSL